MRKVLIWAILSHVVVMAGCVLFLPPMGQAQLNAIETREVDAGFDETFVAASGALFDAGYIIAMSDREGGLLTGTRSIDRSRQRRLLDPKIEDTHFAVSVMIREAGYDRCSVRIKTSVNGAQKGNKRAIDQIWVLMQRQVLMKAPLAMESRQY